MPKEIEKEILANLNTLQKAIRIIRKNTDRSVIDFALDGASDAVYRLESKLGVLQAAAQEEVQEEIPKQSSTIVAGGSSPSRNSNDPIGWAEGLIEQLPTNHDGRNSWLMNFGIGHAAYVIRKQDERSFFWDINEKRFKVL